MDGLFQMEKDSEPVILPVWYSISETDLRNHSPSLAGRLAARWDNGHAECVNALLRVIRGDTFAELNKNRVLNDLAESMKTYVEGLEEVKKSGAKIHVRTNGTDIKIIIGAPSGAGDQTMIFNALKVAESEERWRQKMEEVGEEVLLSIDVMESLRLW